MQEEINRLSTDRSRAMINNLIPMIALAKECGWSIIQLVQWNTEKYYERGYHDHWIYSHGWGNIQAYATFFLKGRALASKKVDKIDHGDKIIIESLPWYLADDVDGLFFYDLELDDLLLFVKELAVAHAKLCGVSMHIVYKYQREIVSLVPFNK